MRGFVETDRQFATMATWTDEQLERNLGLYFDSLEKQSTRETLKHLGGQRPVRRRNTDAVALACWLAGLEA